MIPAWYSDFMFSTDFIFDVDFMFFVLDDVRESSWVHNFLDFWDGHQSDGLESWVFPCLPKKPKKDTERERERERESREYVWDLPRMFFDLRREKLPLESQPYIWAALVRKLRVFIGEPPAFLFLNVFLERMFISVVDVCVVRRPKPCMLNKNNHEVAGID